jgi:hypothetical protein
MQMKGQSSGITLLATHAWLSPGGN